jgi:DNA polymerase-3 subunit delta'
MAFESLKEAQKEAVKILENSYQKNRLSHAYILEGEAGTKKFDTALFFASLLLCEEDSNRPCGVCHSCKRINHLTHPNVYIVKTDKKFITKEMIRDLHDELSKTAVEDGAKIYIIEDADKMNQHAANALLKFYEEPHDNIYGLLLTQNASSLLSTIRSRAQKITFHNIPRAIIIETLLQQGYDEQLTHLAASIYHSTIEAEQFLNHEKLYDMIDLISILFEAYVSHESLVLTYQKESYGLIQSKEDLLLFMDILIHYQKDLIYGKMNHYKKQIFHTLSAITESVIKTKNKAMLLDELDHMLELKKRLDQYVNDRLAMDNLLLDIERRQDDEK